MGTFTYESIAYRFKNPSIDGNLDLLTDGAIIKIAADDDLQLTQLVNVQCYEYSKTESIYKALSSIFKN